VDQQYGLVWNFSKKSATKSNAERAWQTVNKDSTMVRNQRPSSNDHDQYVYLAFLPMRQRQGIILVMLGYHAHSRREKKRRNKITHNRFCGIR